jgi:hypothetical protein
VKSVLAFLVAAVVTANVPAASAASLRLRDVGSAGGARVTGDEDRYIAATTGEGAVQLLDVRTGRRGSIANPIGCSFSDVHDGVLLWTCDAGGSLRPGAMFDLRTRRAAGLPVPTPAPRTFPDGSQYVTIGRHWARVHLYGYHFSYESFVNRATGQTVHPAPDDLRLLADEDSVNLTRRLCNGQRRVLIPDDDAGLGVVAGPLATSGRWAAGTGYEDVESPIGRVQLQRCGQPTRVLRTCRRFSCSQPVITSKWVAWTESTPDSGRIVVRSLTTGRTRRSASRTSGMSPLLLGRRLYVVSAGRLLRASL